MSFTHHTHHSVPRNALCNVILSFNYYNMFNNTFFASIKYHNYYNNRHTHWYVYRPTHTLHLSIVIIITRNNSSTMITIFRSDPRPLCVRRRRSYVDPPARGTYLIYLHTYTSYPPTYPTVCVTLYIASYSVTRYGMLCPGGRHTVYIRDIGVNAVGTEFEQNNIVTIYNIHTTDFSGVR